MVLLGTSRLYLPLWLHLLAILLGSTLPWVPGLLLSLSHSSISFSILLSNSFLFTVFFPRFDRFVREGGEADFSQFLEAILPDLLAYLDDPGLPGARPEDDPLRGRRSGSDRAAEDKRQDALKTQQKNQHNKLGKAPTEPFGFQVPLSICY